jgi:DNA topoisomerase-1
MTILLIVESPSKCKIIEKYLGEKYKVIASCGHFRTLNKLDQIDFNTMEISYTNDKPKVIKMLKEEVKQADEVILATDDDREGEAIAWHICQLCKLPLTTKRILFQEITETALKRALCEPVTINMSRVNSQRTRQILDLYIGYKISPLLWKYIQHTLSAGRCQTPALRMIYEQEQAIKTQSYKTHFIIYGIFTNNSIEFKIHNHIEQADILPFLEKCKDHTFTITKGEPKKITSSPPSILITSTLQQRASQSLSMSPQQVMKNAQTLYENGLITYMRTDCAVYSDDFIKQINGFIQSEYGTEYIGSIKQNEKKAHEGIRITHLEIKSIEIEPSVNRLYDFIYKHTLQSCMSTNIIIQTPYTLDFGFTYLSNHTHFKGWKILNKDNDKSNSWGSYLDNLKKITFDKIVAEEKITSQEFHYSESQLIRQLEKEKIGRPSTFTGIIDSIEKKYVTKGHIKGATVSLNIYELTNNTINESQESKTIEEDSKLSITELGIKVSEFCHTHFNSIFDYRFTENMETQLDLIEENKVEWTQIVKDFKVLVDNLLNVNIDVPIMKYKSLHCGLWKKNAMVLKDGPHGFYIEYKGQSVSLQKFKTPEIINSWIELQIISDIDKEEMITYIKNKDGYVITSNISIRNGPRGNYIFYKKPNMKKPKFFDCSEIKEYIENNDDDKIIDYIQKKYKII